MSHPYLLSKIADPIFALAIGTSSALLRIQRDMRDERRAIATTTMPAESSSSNIPPGSSQSEGSSPSPRQQQEQQPEVKFSEIWEIGSRRVGMWWAGDFKGL